MIDQLEHWDDFKKSAFKPPYPDVRKVRGWVERDEIPGRIIGRDVYIYSDRFFRRDSRSIAEQAMELLSG